MTTGLCGKLALSVCVVAASLGAGEWAAKQQNPDMMVYSEFAEWVGHRYPVAASSYLPFTLPPNIEFRHVRREFDVSYQFNGLGYRGRFPESIAKPVGVKRILVLGDSFTLGWGNSLEDTFVQQVQDFYDERGADRYEIINAGYHCGYSPDSYYACLVREGISLAPNAVVVVLYENDFDDVRDARWYDVDSLDGPNRVTTRRNYTDYVGRFLKAQPGQLPWYFVVPVLRESRLFVSLGVLLDRAIFTKPVQPPEVRRRVNTALRAITELLTGHEIPLLYVTIPEREFLDAPSRRHQWMLHFIADSLKTPVVDVRPTLDSTVYYERDRHLKPVGNAIVAKAITGALQEMHLAPR